MATSAYTYINSTTYPALGQVATVQYGSSTSFATATGTYDPHTGLLTDQRITRFTATPGSVDTGYTYDLFGNITKQTVTRLRSSTTSETQRYTYDPLDRLTAAWIATDACAAALTSTAHSQVGDGITGGAYWTNWSFDNVGNRHPRTNTPGPVAATPPPPTPTTATAGRINPIP